jgi:DNA-binding MarR family transcriptional regulator
MTRSRRLRGDVAPAPADYRLDDQVGFLVRRVHQRATGIFGEVMGRFDVTPTQFAALARLDDVGPVSQNELGRLTAMDPATIWGVVSRLTRRGFVGQSAHRDDARLVMLDLTAEGRAAVREMKAVAAEVSRRTLAPLAPGEADTLLDLLRRLG